ncbi:MAG TPA: hypothetical protein VIM15_02580, partial [Gemmatimonadaceae bacterium]
ADEGHARDHLRIDRKQWSAASLSSAFANDFGPAVRVRGHRCRVSRRALSESPPVSEGVIPQQAHDTAGGSPLYALYVHELQRRRKLVRDHEQEEDAKLNDPSQAEPPDSP